ncbi:hypothetical protein LU699_12435 [Luteimonas fraxinea]|nr:hypothetical protein [Luteimonas fraxinea]UHH09099.1 hypothetical protein LU699_12435 [Luteimonas fraxinea]
MLLSLLVLVGACAHGPDGATDPEGLIRSAPPSAGMDVIYLTGSKTGRLVWRDGCFRIVTPQQRDGGTTLIWPHDYVAVVRDGRRGVMDSEGRTAFDGDRVTLGGGSGGGLPDDTINHARAAACGGPYASAWLPY